MLKFKLSSNLKNEKSLLDYIFKQLELRQNLENDEVLFKAMVEYPKLIQRPIVVIGNKAILGRPPEKVLELLM